MMTEKEVKTATEQAVSENKNPITSDEQSMREQELDFSKRFFSTLKIDDTSVRKDARRAILFESLNMSENDIKQLDARGVLNIIHKIVDTYHTELDKKYALLKKQIKALNKQCERLESEKVSLDRQIEQIDAQIELSKELIHPFTKQIAQMTECLQLSEQRGDSDIDTIKRYLSQQCELVDKHDKLYIKRRKLIDKRSQMEEEIAHIMYETDSFDGVLEVEQSEVFGAKRYMTNLNLDLFILNSLF